jgi:hypothetical protein
MGNRKTPYISHFESCYTSISYLFFAHFFCKSTIKSVGPHIGPTYSIVNLLISFKEIDKRWIKDRNKHFDLPSSFQTIPYIYILILNKHF